MEIYAVSNQKGGVGKTTTSVNLAIGLAKQGKKVLAIDLDQQGSLSISLGLKNPEELEETVTDKLISIRNSAEFDPLSGIYQHPEGIDLLPANITLCKFEKNAVSAMKREYILGKYVDKLDGHYDCIVIDCCPSLGLLTINALACATKVIIPVQAQYLSVKGVKLLFDTIFQVKRRLNRNLEVSGILLTMVNTRTKYSKEIITVLQEEYGENVRIFDSIFPASTRAIETTSTGKSIYEFDKKGKVATAYQEFVSELTAEQEVSMKKDVKLSDEIKLKTPYFEDVQGEQVVDLALSSLITFENHPFKVTEDEKLAELMESIEKLGVTTPIIVREKGRGDYEIIAGHRRTKACELLNLEKIPAFIHDLDDEEAILFMVDTNIQREEILPSERAFAYKMKLEALKRQGERSDLTSTQVAQKWSVVQFAEESGTSKDQVRRFIRLTQLILPLLDLVDQKKLPFNVGVELSFLKSEEQQMVQSLLLTA
ncbi:MAG: AAA family ATPase [Eubacteriales bacterium]